jgi:hypothetical protein
MSAVIAWCLANQTLLLTLALAVSEALGANPKVKSNGILSLVLLQAQKVLKEKGAKDLTPGE